MNTQTFLLNAGGLFDFDLTFLAEILLFLTLAFVVTFVFLTPVSQQLSDRALLINTALSKASILVTLGYENLSTSVNILTQEISELNRQVKLTKSYTNSNFEEEVLAVQTQNLKLLSKLKGELSIKSACLLSKVNKQFITLTDAFFVKKFKS